MSSTRRPATGSQEYETQYGEAAGYPQGSQPPGYPQGTRPGRRSGGVSVFMGTMLAGVLMILSGLYGFLGGLAMVLKGGFFAFHAGYAYNWTTHGWGWTELIVGAVVFAAGVCVLMGMTWARVVGVIVATLSALGSFLILPYYPVWSLILIAIDVFIIWALVAHGRRAPI